MKKGLRILTLLVVMLALFVLPAGAEEEAEAEAAPTSGACGEDVSWRFEKHTLTISGNGPMEDYKEETPPWEDYQDEIRKVVFTGNVTTVGWNSFRDYDEITAVDFGSSMHTIGAYAFSGCDGLTQIHLPETFRIFDVECLRSCSNLKAIYCAGGAFPSFKGSCLWNTQTKIIYPANNPWPVELIDELEGAFAHHIEFVDSNGVDHNITGYEGDFEDVEEEVMALEETEPETTVPETTVPETTVPETTVPPATVPETTEPETTVPETTEETELETTAFVWETVKPTEAPARRGGSSTMTGVFILAAVVAAMVIATVIFVISEKNHRNYY